MGESKIAISRSPEVGLGETVRIKAIANETTQVLNEKLGYFKKGRY